MSESKKMELIIKLLREAREDLKNCLKGGKYER